MTCRGFFWALAFAVCALPLASCAGSGLMPAGALTAERPVTFDSPVEAAQFNPFGEPPSSAPAREVILDPTVADVMKPGVLPEMSWGRADAPVTIVKYASLTCRYCRAFHLETFPELKRAYIDTGKVRFVIREFPIGKASGAATIALRCAPPEKYLDLYGKFLTQQSAWVSQDVRLDAIFAVAKQVGMTRAEFDGCLANQGMIAGLKEVKDRGRTLGIIGTPNFFVQGTLVKKIVGMADIRAMIEPMLASSRQP